MVASVLKRGNVAIVSYATDPIGPDGDDIIRFVILAPIGSGTQIFFSDRNWNGTAFPAASAGEGTFTYTAGADLPAGTVITITSAQLLAAGMDLSNNGDTVYVYQGTDANTPTTFLYAIDFGDDNSVFEAGELTGTGLTAGVDAVAVAFDQASYAGQSTQIPQTQLSSISTSARWHGHSGDDIGGTIYDDRADVTLSGPLNNPDMQLFGMMSGGGQSDAFIRMDNDEAGNVATNLTRLFRDNPSFTHLTDLAFDIEDGFWFAVDNDGSSTTRLLKGNIADLVSGTSTPTITVLYDFPNDDDNVPVDDDSFIDGIEIDTVGNKIYFIQGDIVNGHNLKSISYTGTGLTDYGAIQLAVEPTVGFFGGVFDFTLDVAHNTAYFTYVLVNSTPPPSAAINYIVKVNSLSNPALGYSIVQINGSDDPDGAGGNPANHFPQVEGSLAGVDIDIANQRLYFVTQRLGADGTAGVFMLDLVTHNYVELWQQQSNNATNTLQPFPTTQMEYIEVDTIGGRYYVSTLNNTDTAVGHDGTATDEGGSRIFSGALATTAGQPAPTVFASVFENTANGAVLGMEIDYAPTLTVGSAGSTYTESTNLPGSPAGPTVDVATSPVVNDADQAIIQGATVAISTGFVTGDQLTFTNSGGITGSYNATTGVVTFTGNASFAAYQTVLDSVRFTNAGDNPTDYGASTSRIISFTVTDGLLNSDPATATVTVVGINDAPVNTIQGAALAISEDALNAVLSTTGNAISVFDVDANPATQDISVTLSVTQGTITILTNVVGGIVAGDITAGANGSSTITITATQNQINATLAAANGLLYNPIADYNGSDTLTIVTNDQGFNGTDPLLTGTGTSEQDSDSRTINIAAVVDIANDTVNIAEDAGAQNLNLLANDNFENAGRAITAVGTASHGTVTINDNGTAGNLTDDFVVYTATADYNGSDSFTYTVTSGGVTEQATVTVNISAVQDIAADTIPLNEDAGPSQLNLLANDSFENSGRAITAVGTASHGTVTINNNGTAGDATDDYVVYTPTADYNGSDSFTYTVTSGGVTEQATATINIAAVADIADDTVTVAEDSGTNSLNGIGNPVSLLANDSFENASRAITAVGAALHGTTAINNNGTAGDATDDYVTYTPTGNYAGPDSFTYTVTSGGVTETATVNVTVTAVNDDPINTKPGTQTINEDATLTFSAVGGNVISISDIDAAPGTLTVTLAVVNGQLTLSGTTGLSFSGGSDGTDDTSMTFTGTATDINAALNGLLYETTLDYNGTDTLTITTNDNGNTGTPGALQDMDTVTINITAIQDATNDTIPLAEDAGASNLDLLGNDSFENPGRSITSVTQGLHGFVSINDNNTVGTTDDFVVYTAAADYNGADSFTYTVTSGGVTETATANVNISAVVDIADDAPTVGEDSGTTTIDVIANDSFENGGFSITSVTQGLHGTVTIIDGPDADLNPDYVTYTPTADYYGADSFTYTVTSGGVTETATVNVTVTAVADIADDSVGVIQDSGVNALNLLANDTFENAGRGITAVGAALHGTVAINNNGTPGNVTDDFVTYTPTGGYIGPDTFTYTVTSGGVTETATVSVTVAPANLAPVVDLNDGTPGINDTGIFAEGIGDAAIGTSIAVSDADAGDMIEGATITLTDPIAGDEIFANLPLPGGILISGASTSTTIILTGSASVANYASALGQIGYRNTGDNPTLDGTDTSRTITVTVTDGDAISTPAATMTLTIVGQNDAAIITGDSSGDVTEAGGVANATPGDADDTGDLNSTDVDNADDAWQVVAPGAASIGGYGSYALTAAGVWTYTVDDSDAAVQALNGAATLTDTFNALTADGTSQTVTITIHAQNDAATITGDASGDVTEAGGVNNGTPGDADDTGDLDAGDIDNAADAWQVVAPGTASIGGYGTYALTAAGVWTYTVDDSDAAVQALNGAATLTDTFNALTADGTSQTVTITIHAQDDGGVAHNDAVTTDEANAISGSVLVDNGSGADTDVDTSPPTVSAVNGSAIAVGTQITLPSGALLTLNADGTFDYDPNGAYDETPVPATGASNTPESDNFNYTLTNGTTAMVTITITGIDTNDRIEGTAGADTLIADGGTDQLLGFAGDDTYYVNSAGDLVVEAVGEGRDVVYTSVSYALAAGSSVEVLSTDSLGGTGAIDLTGNAFGNLIVGNAGANVLNGAGGADYLVGLGGDDTYFVDTAGDLVIEQAGQGRDVVYASVSYALAAGSSVEVLSTVSLADTAAINLTGNELGNIILGNAGANVLNGGGGADYMAGFGGDDSYYVDTAGDVVSEATNQGRDVVYASASYALAAGVSVEVLSTDSLAGTAAINLTGNELGNVVHGNAGDNVLNGGGGADFLVGLGGDDTYYVDNLGDIVVEDANGGQDVVYASTSYVLTAGSSVEVLSAISLTAFTPINLTGNDLTNVVNGNAGSNVVNGGGGADYLVGGGGADSFAFTTALGSGNVDFVADFTGISTDGDDIILLDDAVFTGLALGALDENAFFAGTAAHDADDRIIYDSDTGSLYFDADGNGAGAAILFATLDNTPALTAGDFSVI